MEFPQGIPLDIINDFFSPWLLLLNIFLLRVMILLHVAYEINGKDPGKGLFSLQITLTMESNKKQIQV